MEDGLKQRIYENILRLLENYRYIKSTAEATIPNFIYIHSPYLLSFRFFPIGKTLAHLPKGHITTYKL